MSRIGLHSSVEWRLFQQPLARMSTLHQRFRNSDPEVLIGDFPWHEMIWRNLRGDFQPKVPPQGGYAAFARAWSTPVDLARLHQRQQQPTVTWLGHVTILLQVGGLNVLTDPTLADFAGPFGRVGAMRMVPAPLNPAQLPPIDLVLISHNHYDHLCWATIRALLRAGQSPRFAVPMGLAPWFHQRGIAQVQEMSWWDCFRMGPLTVTFTPAQHWSRRTPWDTNASHWGGYLVKWSPTSREPWRFLFPGDTGYSKDFAAIRKRLGPIDFLALPIGAYLPRDFMRRMHVNPADAVQMMVDLDAQQAMGVHWGTFKLTQEAFDQPIADLVEALAARQMPADKVWLLKHGETRAIAMA